jgi:rRNA-processing protein FCF1
VAIFVINEWFWADSSGRNGQTSQRQALDVIENLARSQDQIVVIVGSAFDRKAWACCNSADAYARRLAGAFHSVIRVNSERCRLVPIEDAAVLPEQLASTINADDHYLVRAQLTIEGAVLVTTDAPLREAVQRAGLPCLSREEFIGIAAGGS